MNETHTLLPAQLSRTVSAVRSANKLPWPLKILIIYLAAVTIFGKGPTYIGVEPIFWGELVLALSLIWAVRVWPGVRIRSSQVTLLTMLVTVFMLLGATEAILNVPTWGIDALRDSATWYYGLFYFVGLAIASTSVAEPFGSAWRLSWIIAIPWGVVELLSNSRLSSLSPILPRAGAPILSGSGSETIQAIGLGSILLLLDHQTLSRLGSYLRLTLATIALLVATGSHGRGARLAVFAALVVSLGGTIPLKAAGRQFRNQLLAVGVILLVAGGAALTLGVDLTSALQLDRFEGASLTNPDGTTEWRTDWWQELYAAVLDQNPAFGLGFGVNIADYSPYLEDQESDHPVRSPHNVNMTVFSRMGIIGTALWMGILAFGVFGPVLKAGSSPGAGGAAEHRRYVFWLAAIVATWVNASFGVLMEGPVLGIPFWLLLGLIAGHACSRQRTHRSPGRTTDRIAVPEPIAI